MITLADPIAHARRCFGDRIAVIVSANGHRYFEALFGLPADGARRFMRSWSHIRARW